jgi:hypothetical protein
LDFFDFFCVKLKWLFIGSILCLNKNSFSQCIGTDFSLPASVCKDSRIYVQNLAGIADGFTWDFCVGDLENTPKAMPLTTLSGWAQMVWLCNGYFQQYSFSVRVCQRG